MKKLSLLIFHQDYQRFLEALRGKGVVHIHENKERSTEDETLHLKLSMIRRVNDMIQKMKNRGQTEKVGVVQLNDDEQLEEHLKRKFHRQEQIQQQLGALQKELSMYEPWGDFSGDRIKALQEAGWTLRFYTIQEQKFNPEWGELAEIVEINTYKGQKYFITISSKEHVVEVEADPFQFPDASKEELLHREKQLQAEYAALDKYLNEITVDAIAHLEHYRECIYEQTDEMHIKNASHILVDEKVVALEGWYPVDREEEVKEFLYINEVYFETSKSTKEDDVPVLLKNNRFSRLFEPIGEMYDMPNYKELDLTPFFAPFFMLFFGLCMGDGGYGLLIWLVCFLLKRKVSDNLKSYLKLGEYLGLATLVVGILTGSFFGIALDSVTWPWLQGVKQYFITQDNFGKYLGGYNPMMFFAFGIGMVQILFGMCLNIVKITMQHGFKYALSETGWVVLLVTAIIAFGLPILGVEFSAVLNYIFYAIMGVCAVAILFLNSPDKNIFVNLGSGIWGTYNMATGLLGDILSYVRLFALGLTGSILGSVFNMLAMDMTATLPFIPKFLLMLFILLVGHGLNFAIAMIGALVHPMRLTFVEFYKSAGFEGMGKKYTPFRKRT
ncbi:ATPase [Odoribacter sp. OttesenSCG-928-A06]|nr:ATPase [Odoribacter sp. OttesenSCG-928-A06]